MESIRDFDESDSYCERRMSLSNEVESESEREGGARALATRTIDRPQVPNHLLMVALLEQICALMVKDKSMRRELFKLICTRLSEMKVMSPLTFMDEFSNIREQYRSSLSRMINAAKQTLEKSKTFGISFIEPQNIAKLFEPREIPRVPAIAPHTVFSMQSTRYETEFAELCGLGKGGFGNVYKCRHKLDGCEYAVKKIRFRTSRPDACFRILREVKVLARLSHDNIVRYNNAWVEELPSVFNSFTQGYPALESKPGTTNMVKDTTIGTPAEESILFDADASRLRELDELPKLTELKSPTSMEVGVDSKESFSFDLSTPSAACASEDISSIGCASNPSGLHDNGLNFCDLKSIPLKRKGSDKSCEDDIKKQHSEAIEESRRIRRRSGEKPTGLGDPPFISKQDLQRSLSVNDSMKKKSPSTSPNKLAPVNDEKCPSCARPFHFRSISFDPRVCDMCDEKQFKRERSWHRDYPNSVGRIHLFIQMELCEQTLKDWMDQRNAADMQVRYDIVNKANNLKIFKQTLEGLAYIHRQKLIHRDIKPRNIFINTSNLQVKIGDFGLARDLWSVTLEDATNEQHHNGHTKKVGTSLYASPEQLMGSDYDAKSDMYSLGVVLYEMFQPYNTGMERVESLKSLRKGVVCPVLRTRWSSEMQCMEKMISQNHQDRPSAEELLKSNMFPSKKVVCVTEPVVDDQWLVSCLEDKDLIINKQQALLKEKDEIIAEKDTEIAALKSQLLDLQMNSK